MIKPEASRPLLRELLYAPANLDESRKSCASCGHFLQVINGCELHGPHVPVAPDMLCNLHVEGLPLTSNVSSFRDDLRFVTAAQSNLQAANGGASCDRCTHFDPTLPGSGDCLAAEDERGERAMVAALGRCVLWSPA